MLPNFLNFSFTNQFDTFNILMNNFFNLNVIHNIIGIYFYPKQRWRSGGYINIISFFVMVAKVPLLL